MCSDVDRDSVLKANVYIHTTLIDLYDDQPHFRPENKQKVTNLLRGLREELQPTNRETVKMLDMGCGTGFVIHLAKDLYDEIHGVDITPAMLDKVDTSSGNVFLHNGSAEETPYEDGAFDLVTAYSFMDHLYELRPFLEEVFRVLRPGGIFYSDQNANRAFWQAVSDLEQQQIAGLSDILEREITAGLYSEEEYAKQKSIDTQAFRNAEFIKTHKNGIDAQEVQELSADIGFSSCEARFDWYLGQGNIMHQQSFDNAAIIEAFLRRVWPLSNHLFKYLRFVLRK